jgi:hypothetical protein
MNFHVTELHGALQKMIEDRDAGRSLDADDLLDCLISILNYMKEKEGEE